jgi:hypothetical protein
MTEEEDIASNFVIYTGMAMKYGSLQWAGHVATIMGRGTHMPKHILMGTTFEVRPLKETLR